MTDKQPGQLAYEADVALRPNYHDGSPRKTWDELDNIERWSWSRPAREEFSRQRRCLLSGRAGAKLSIGSLADLPSNR